MELVGEMLSYPFLMCALVSGILVSLCASLLGVSLVLKRYSMIRDGLPHVSSGVLSVVLTIDQSPLKLSIPVVVLAALFPLRATESGKMKSDATIAMISASTLTVGIVVTSITMRVTTGVSSYMFSSILTMGPSGVRFSVAFSVIVLGPFLLCYNKILTVTFGESSAKTAGVRMSWYNILIAVLMAATIMLGIRMIEAMLTSSLIIFPALTSMRVFKSFRGVVLSTGVVSTVCFGISTVISYRFSTPAGTNVVLVNLAALILFALAQTVIRRLIRKGQKGIWERMKYAGF